MKIGNDKTIFDRASTKQMLLLFFAANAAKKRSGMERSSSRMGTERVVKTAKDCSPI